MLEMEQGQDDLQAAITNHTLFVRIIGRGSFKVAASLKQFVIEITTIRPNTMVVFDLEDCIGMDSTFMGVLAGLAGRFKKTNQLFELINLSGKNALLLKTLGVDHVLSVYKNAHGHQLMAQKTESIAIDQASKKELAETALKAHEKLVQIREENIPRFKRVIDFLKEDVDRLT